MRKYIDFYVPQIYTQKVADFEARAVRTKRQLGDCTMVPGFAISWSSIYPKRIDAETTRALVDAARRSDGRGYVVFHYDHFQPEHFATFNEIRLQHEKELSEKELSEKRE